MRTNRLIPRWARFSPRETGTVGAIKNQDRQRGLAAVEMALFAVSLAAMLMVLVESFKAYSEYSVLEKAANEGARMVVHEAGDTAAANSLVHSMTSNLGGAAPNINFSVTTDANRNKNVTVKVDHVYQPFFVPTDKPPVDLLGGKTLTLSSSSTMRLP